MTDGNTFDCICHRNFKHPKVTFNENGEPTVGGRELHGFLEVGTPYKKWFGRMVEYGFTENVDFAVMDIFVQDETAFGGQRKTTDHIMTLDMAKEPAVKQITSSNPLWWS